MKKKQVNVLSCSEMSRRKPILLSGLMIMLSVLMTFSAAASSALELQQKRVSGEGHRCNHR
ncbi:MAG: hypothetical protein U5L72_08685 [Bacteroidales bacterium]|nr:hypothetical protein [Bacteroidales bacterium]